MKQGREAGFWNQSLADMIVVTVIGPEAMWTMIFGIESKKTFS